MATQPLAGLPGSGGDHSPQRFDVARTRGLTPLVGREHEVGLLRERWAQAMDGKAQVVLLSGEAGTGESRLAQEVQDQSPPCRPGVG